MVSTKSPFLLLYHSKAVYLFSDFAGLLFSFF